MKISLSVLNGERVKHVHVAFYQLPLVASIEG